MEEEQKKEEARRRTREWYQNNKERKKAYDKAYFQRNKEAKRAYNLVYKKKHKERLKQQQKEYQSRPEIIEKRKAYGKKYREENKERLTTEKAKYYQTNKERLIEKGRVYREENRERIRQRDRELYTPERAAKRKAYKQRPDIKKRQREYENQYKKERYHSDTNYKLIVTLRNRITSAIHNNCKSGSAIDDLGCTIEELKVHLESQFKEGMTWDNWTHDGWHIDHKKQLSKFDLTDREQFKEAAHYTNLQPLWWWENLEKREW